MEFALVLPLFMLLVMGALDYGYYFFCSQVVTNAAREGARAGTLTNPTSSSGVATASATTVALNYMNGNGVSCPGGAGDNSCIDARITNPLVGVDAVQVTITFNPWKSITGFTQVVLPSRLIAKAVMLWR